MSFGRFVLRRFVYSIILILSVIVFNFLLIHMAPGDPALTLAGEAGGTTPEILAEIRATYGLDKPLIRQLLVYGERMARGDMGISFYSNEPVFQLILQRVPATLLLVVVAEVVAVLVGVCLGILAARKPYGYFSNAVTVISIAGFSMPVFWLGLMLIILFGYLIPIFPSFGMRTVGMEGGMWEQYLDILHHLVLPAVTLAFIDMAMYSRLARASMLEVLKADYIRTARSSGLGEGVITYKHSLRNAVLPVVTLTGLNFSRFFAGAVIVETVFNWPGMGQLAFDSILRRDYPVVLGILFFSTLIVIVANCVTDLSYSVLDPRIRRE